jgi:hypothetical protein
MEYKVETSLYNFPAWQGGEDTLNVLKERDDWEAVEELIETTFLEADATDEDINDFLWFERDLIAQHLGYADWDEYESGEEKYKDINGVELAVSDEVHWHDEAGHDDDGSMITFTIVEDNGDGYFNLSYGDEDENPDRWAYYTELEIV